MHFPIKYMYFEHGFSNYLKYLNIMIISISTRIQCQGIMIILPKFVLEFNRFKKVQLRYFKGAMLTYKKKKLPLFMLKVTESLKKNALKIYTK